MYMLHTGAVRLHIRTEVKQRCSNPARFEANKPHNQVSILTPGGEQLPEVATAGTPRSKRSRYLCAGPRPLVADERSGKGLQECIVAQRSAQHVQHSLLRCRIVVARPSGEHEFHELRRMLREESWRKPESTSLALDICHTPHAPGMT